MYSIEFPGCNRRYEKPKGWTDEQCGGLDAMEFPDPNTGAPIIRTAWMPNKEDIEAINAGRPIVFDMYIPCMIPVAVFTFDETGQINE